MLLWKELAHDMANLCHTSTDKDYETVLARSKHEGFSFLTITLPSFGKDFEKSLDLGRVDRSLFLSFKRRAGLPLFLGGFLDQVFDRSSGVLLTEPSVDAIYGIRQLTLLVSKMFIPCSDARAERAMLGYLECEKEVRISDSLLSEIDLLDFKRVSNMLFGEMFTEIDQKVFDGVLLPKHGPGATADGFRANGKYQQNTWPTRAQEIFRKEDFLVPNSNFWNELSGVELLEPEAEIPVKVISVPKTQKTTRIIGIEPVAMQYLQQSLYPELVDGIKKTNHLRRIIGFTDQIPNQEMAREGSENGKLATLDLSEASDRVSNQLVRTMMSDYPHLHWAVDACRSRKALVKLRDKDVSVRLAKFASMGSALCFPVEAMVFTTLIFLAIERESSTLLDPAKVATFAGKVRIYGDDIIIPVDYVESVVRVLETFGSRVNSGKSFWTGKFRESCGKEYYDGQDVSIVKVRQVLPTHRKHATPIISTVSLRNQLYFSGCWVAVKWLDEKIRGLIRHFPVVLPSSGVLGRHSFLDYQVEWACERLHTPLVRGYSVVDKTPSDPLDGVFALQKSLLLLEHRNSSALPGADETHLLRAGRSPAVDIQLGWKTPF